MRALIALGEKAESIDLLHEVGDAGPSPEPEAHHEHPRNHEGVDHIRPGPTTSKFRRPLHRVLHLHSSSEKENTKYDIKGTMESEIMK